MRPGNKFLLAASLVAMGALAAASGASWAGPPPGCTLNIPTLECAGATPTSITLRVCAGASGAPAGVSIQWKKYSDYLVDGWAQTGSYCALSLSGNCPASRFDLGPSGCENITIHATTVTDENAAYCGASGCAQDLECDTEYIFRVFAHNVPGGCNASDKSTGTVCRTAPCTGGGECTLTWGYWKTHGPTGCNPSGHDNLWPVSSLTVGCLNLTDAQVCDILQQNPKACAKGSDPNNGANTVLILEHQLIAAMLNRANGAIVCAFADQAIANANALLCGKEYDCVGASTTFGQQLLAVKDLLAAYNDDQCACPVAPFSHQATADDEAAGVKQSSGSDRAKTWGKVKTVYR